MVVRPGVSLICYYRMHVFFDRKTDTERNLNYRNQPKITDLMKRVFVLINRFLRHDQVKHVLLHNYVQF